MSSKAASVEDREPAPCAPMPSACDTQAADDARASALTLRLVRRGYRLIRNFEGALVALIAMFVYLSIDQPFFLTKANLLNILVGNADLFLVAIGLTFVVISSGFDLSVGPMVAGSGLIVYELASSSAPGWLCVAGGITAALAFGAVVNGGLIGVAKLNFFVVTLGTMSVISGMVSVVTTGQTETISAGGFFSGIGNNDSLGIPNPVWICIAVAGLGMLILKFTSFGRAIFAVGGNREAARLAGINVPVVLILVYGLAGLCAGIGGVVDASRLGAVSPGSGSNLALTAGAAVLLGGTSFFGGSGGIGGTLVGCCLIGVLQNGLGLIGISSYWQSVVTGAVLIAAVALDRARNRSVQSG